MRTHIVMVSSLMPYTSIALEAVRPWGKMCNVAFGLGWLTILAGCRKRERERFGFIWERVYHSKSVKKSVRGEAGRREIVVSPIYAESPGSFNRDTQVQEHVTDQWPSRDSGSCKHFLHFRDCWYSSITHRSAARLALFEWRTVNDHDQISERDKTFKCRCGCVLIDPKSAAAPAISWLLILDAFLLGEWERSKSWLLQYLNKSDIGSG